MLSLRVTRDKRGYEHIYLVADARRRGRADSRLVYWCRMPGGLRVGREPFDADTRDSARARQPGPDLRLAGAHQDAEPVAGRGALGGAAGPPGRRRGPRGQGRDAAWPGRGDGRGRRAGAAAAAARGAPGGRDRGRGGDGGKGREPSGE